MGAFYLICWSLLVFSQVAFGNTNSFKPAINNLLGNSLLSDRYEPRLVGGKDAPEGRFPYMASVRALNVNICGGAILNKNWVVTAASCIDYVLISAITVGVGSTNLELTGHIYNAVDLIWHKDFSRKTMQNDIGLVQVPDIAFNEKVQPISIYIGILPDPVDVILLGWGVLKTGQATPKQLQYLNGKSISLINCQRINHSYPVIDSHTCTFSPKEGACFFDEGGPVITTNKKGQDLLVGIISLSRRCAVGYPDVHTRVHFFVPWINDICSNCLNGI